MFLETTVEKRETHWKVEIDVESRYVNIVTKYLVIVEEWSDSVLDTK